MFILFFIKNPMVNIEQLWKDYCVFENVNDFVG